VLEREGAARLLAWKDPEKPGRLLAITRFFIQEHVETLADLAAWLSIPSNRPRLLQLRGVGPKTADYFKILAGLQAVSVGSHLLNFLAEAGCPASDYAQARDLIQIAADYFGLPYTVLDHNIWRLMSTRL